MQEKTNRGMAGPEERLPNLGLIQSSLTGFHRKSSRRVVVSDRVTAGSSWAVQWSQWTIPLGRRCLAPHQEVRRSTVIMSQVSLDLVSAFLGILNPSLHRS